MGIDYRFSGSASYPRFDREMEAIAKIFGGERPILKDGQTNLIPREYSFPENINPTIKKWLNYPYNDDFSSEDTREIWEEISKHPEIREISDQIWDELETLVGIGWEWYIY